MRDDAFRAYLAPALTSKAVSDYLSCARRVERLLGIDLDTTDLSKARVASFADKLSQAGVERRVVSSCMTALRSYATFRAGIPKESASRPLTTGRVAARPLAAVEPVSVEPSEPIRSNPLSLRSVPELMQMYAAILSELRRRNVTRTGNGPVGDYAEMLFATTFRWQLTGNSNAGHDAVDASGRRYQIKAPRLHSTSTSRQLGSIRRLTDKPFDDLAVLLFDADMAVSRAAIVPLNIVEQAARYVAHTNSWRMMMPDSIWSMPGVRDVSDAIRATVGGPGR